MCPITGGMACSGGGWTPEWLASLVTSTWGCPCKPPPDLDSSNKACYHSGQLRRRQGDGVSQESTLNRAGLKRAPSLAPHLPPSHQLKESVLT